jgi:PleD family two-component response regulator
MTAVHDLRHDDLSLIVVDDARTGRIYFMRALEQAGYDDVRVAESAHRALELMAERPADVIIADWLMPGMDGLELTQRVRERDEDQSRYTAVILSTAREGVSALVTAFRSGVDDFLHKPFDAEELIARIFAAGSQANARNMLLETTQTLADKRAARVENWATDAMTGLGGADYFEAQLTTHLMEIAMRGGAVCAALVDVSGPAVEVDDPTLALTRAGRRIVRAVRPTDAVCRIDALRFGIVMSAPDASGFREGMFGRIEREVAGRPIAHRGAHTAIAVDIGYAYWEGPGTALSPGELQSRAERQLRDRAATA